MQHAPHGVVKSFHLLKPRFADNGWKIIRNFADKGRILIRLQYTNKDPFALVYNFKKRVARYVLHTKLILVPPWIWRLRWALKNLYLRIDECRVYYILNLKSVSIVFILLDIKIAAQDNHNF